MGTLCAGKGCRLDSQARRSGRPDLDLDALIAQELDTGASVDSTTPVLPEERRIPDDKRMEQDAHLARLARFATLPLALLAQRAGAATANAGGIHHTQASNGFSAVFVRNQLLVSRAPKRPIELANKVLAGKAADKGKKRSALALNQCFKCLPIARQVALCQYAIRHCRARGSASCSDSHESPPHLLGTQCERN